MKEILKKKKVILKDSIDEMINNNANDFQQDEETLEKYIEIQENTKEKENEGQFQDIGELIQNGKGKNDGQSSIIIR